MDNLSKVGVFLWSLSFIMLFTLGLSMITTVTYPTETYASTDTEKHVSNATIDTQYFKLDISDDYTLDLFVNSTKTNIFIDNLNLRSGSGIVGLTNPSIDSEMNSTASVGLCAVGLDTSDSPVTFNINESSNTVTTDIESSNKDNFNKENNSAEDILEKCT